MVLQAPLAGSFFVHHLYQSHMSYVHRNYPSFPRILVAFFCIFWVFFRMVCELVGHDFLKSGNGSTQEIVTRPDHCLDQDFQRPGGRKQQTTSHSAFDALFSMFSKDFHVAPIPKWTCWSTQLLSNSCFMKDSLSVWPHMAINPEMS